MEQTQNGIGNLACLRLSVLDHLLRSVEINFYTTVLLLTGCSAVVSNGEFLAETLHLANLSRASAALHEVVAHPIQGTLGGRINADRPVLLNGSKPKCKSKVSFDSSDPLALQLHLTVDNHPSDSAAHYMRDCTTIYPNKDNDCTIHRTSNRQ